MRRGRLRERLEDVVRRRVGLRGSGKVVRGEEMEVF